VRLGRLIQETDPAAVRALEGRAPAVAAKGKKKG